MPVNTEPKVSICIPTFNRSDLLRKTLISVTKQTVKPWEVIVVDNCSQDETEKIARNFKDIKFFRNDVNLGMIDNWNRCIELATGDFITLLHSDDIIAPDWHEEWQKIIKKNDEEDVGAYFSATFTIDNEENAKIVYRVFPEKTLLKPGEAFTKMWKRNMCSLPASGAIIYRKSIFNVLGKFNKAYSTEADIAFSLKLLNKFCVFYTPKLLFAYRIHSFQSFDADKKIKDNEKRFSTLKRHLAIFTEFYGQLPADEYRTPLFYKRLGYMYIAIAVFCFFSLQFKKASSYYKLTKAALPDMLNNIDDYLRILTLMFHYAKKIIIGRIEAFIIRGIPQKWTKE